MCKTQLTHLEFCALMQILLGHVNAKSNFFHLSINFLYRLISCRVADGWRLSRHTLHGQVACLLQRDRQSQPLDPSKVTMLTTESHSVFCVMHATERSESKLDAFADSITHPSKCKHSYQTITFCRLFPV